MVCNTHFSFPVLASNAYSALHAEKCTTRSSESFSWSPNYQGVAGKQEIIDGIRRKSELVFNISKAALPDATVYYYDYGAAYWLLTGSTDGCYNVPPHCSVRGDGPGNPGPSCPDGYCTNLGFTLD